MTIIKNAIRCFETHDMQIDDAIMWETYMKLLKHAFKDEEVAIIKLMLSTNNEENKMAY